MSSMPVIDGREFSEKGERLEGVAKVREFPRLASLDTGTGRGELRYAVLGNRDAQGRAGLEIRVEGTIELICQRCLEPMQHSVDLDVWLGLGQSEAEIEADPVEAPDRIVATPQMAVSELVEEEVMLALPFAPRHEQGCSAAAEAEKHRDASPFGGLRRLIG